MALEKVLYLHYGKTVLYRKELFCYVLFVGRRSKRKRTVNGSLAVRFSYTHGKEFLPPFHASNKNFVMCRRTTNV
jgi:hypothetical protein